MSLITKYIYNEVAKRNIDIEDAKKLLKEIKNTSREDDDIAIIGMACKLPGANNINEYWTNLVEGNICISEFPKERRKDTDSLLKDPYFRFFLTGEEANNEENIDDLYTVGGYLSEIDKFDAGFFGISSKEATYMDPIQRLFLETAWQSIEDSGYTKDKIYGSRTGVFVGRDYTPLSIYKYVTKPDSLHLTGSWTGILASRISYILNLTGPSAVIDTACSSGLVAVHNACKAIKNNECDQAIAGGITINYTPFNLKNQSTDMSMVESKNSYVKTFDRDANGTVWGEGVCSVFLKPLKKALKDGDNIYAVIKSSAINNDGASNGITAPNREAQEEIILRAWKEGKINPETISYTEAHGTGTILGDPIEIKALTNAFAKHTDKKQFCAIGSVKPSIGHTVAASGVAGLIKVVLSMNTSTLPASLNFRNPNPYINFCESPLYVNDKLKKWDTDYEKRRAGISSFGFSGTNCYMVLEEISREEKPSVDDSIRFNILPISAKNEDTLLQLVKCYYEYINKSLKDNGTSLSYSVALYKEHYECRLGIIFTDINDLKDKLNKIIKNGLKDYRSDFIYYMSKEELKNINNIDELEEEIDKNVENKVIDFNDTNILQELCEYYIKGVNIRWEKVYSDKKISRIRLPLYPLNRKRYWAEEKDMKIKRNDNKDSHPLLSRIVVDSMDEIIYSTKFRVNDFWVLKEHMLLGNYLLPGVAYLELAREVCSREYKSNNIELKEVVFLAPLSLKEDEEKEVQTIIKRKKDCLEFFVASKNVKQNNWNVHAQGKAVLFDRVNDLKFNLENMSIEFNEVIKDGDYINSEFNVEENAFTFGDRWNVVKSVKAKTAENGFEQLLVKVELNEKFSTDLDGFFLHPALLDNAINVIIANLNKGQVYVPFSYGNIKIHNRMPRKFFSNIKINKANQSSDDFVMYDVLLFDDNGNVFAEVKDYTVKKLSESDKINLNKANQKNGYYGFKWIEAGDIGCEKPLDNILVFLNNNKFEDNVINKLSNRSNKLIKVTHGTKFTKITENEYIIEEKYEDYIKLIESIKDNNISTIIHMNTMEDKSDITSIEELMNTQQNGVYSLFRLIKSLILNKVNSEIDIFIVSKQVNEVIKNEAQINYHNSTLIGIAQTISLENKNINVRCIDFDNFSSSEELCKEICSNEKVFQVAYRNNKRYIQEFNEINIINNEEISELNVLNQGTYIITGGLGSLGLEVTKYLASKTKVNIVLIGRKEFSIKEKKKSVIDIQDKKELNIINIIKDIESMGSCIDYYSCDISNMNECISVINKIKEKYSKVNGVVHCAGVAGAGYIINKDEEEFHRVISPKIKGSWILDKILEKDQLDFMVMFSSISSVIPMAGQSDYSAANYFMNSFAAFRNNNGKRTIAIQWPAWAEVGMAVDFNAIKHDNIFKAISTSDSIKSLDLILRTKLINVIPAEINYDVYNVVKDSLPFKISKELKNFMDNYSFGNSHEDEKTNKKTSKKYEEIKVIGKEKLSEVGKKLVALWAEVLEIDEIDVNDSFNALGGDSILATQLLKVIDYEYPNMVDIVDIFTYSSILKMDEYIKGKLGLSTEIIEVNHKQIDYSNSTIKDGFQTIKNTEPYIYLIDNNRIIYKEKAPKDYMASNCYIITNNGEGVLIDAGIESKYILGIINRFNIKVKYIILTHGHVDHIYWANEIKDATNSQILVHIDDKNLIDDGKNSGIYYLGREDKVVKVDKYLNNNETIAIGDMKLEIISSPGHTKGGMSVKVGKNLFVGDLIFRNFIGNPDKLNGGDEEQLIQSIKYIINEFSADTIIYPGHGEFTTIGKEVENNNFFKNIIDV